MTKPESSTVQRGAGGGPAGIITGVIALALVAIAVALFSLASQVKYGNCVAAQSAKYPAIGVSAFNTKATGPIKVAYDEERRRAVNSC